MARKPPASYDPRYSFNGWVFLKAHTVFAQWCRQREKQPGGLPEVEIPDSQPDPLEATSRRLDAETVLSAVRDRLGQEPYEAFVLYYEGGLTQQEIAHTLGRDRKTIAGRLSQAHRLIDQLLEKK